MSRLAWYHRGMAPTTPRNYWMVAVRPEYYDKCAVEDISNELKANDYRFTALLNGVISSKPFLMSNTKMENDE